MKLTAWGIISILSFLFTLVWIYEANPYNVFQRGENGK